MKYRDSNEKYAVCFSLPAMGAGDIHRDITQITVNGTFNGQPFNKTYRVTGGGTETISVEGLETSSISNYEVIGSEFVDMGTTFVGIKTGLDLGPTTPTCTITLTDSSGATTVTTVSTVSTLLNKIYVNENSGDDNNTGTVSSPVKTIGNALEKLRDVPKGNVILQSDISLTGEVTVGSGISATVTTDGSGRTVTNGAGRVFNITSGGSLILGKNITLTGTNAGGSGGAVYVDGGSFTMESGSKITGSSADYGGGVFVNGGTFTMESGSIITGSSAGYAGGGVSVSGGEFIMRGGTIGGNDPGSDNTASYDGGGVYVDGGTFTLSGGTISGNSSSRNGGGVYVNDGNFTMESGSIITGSSAGYAGGGVYVSGGNFTMDGGTIGGNDPGSANTASYDGGGVYVDGGTFSVSGSPTITGNTVSNNANNVYLPGGKPITIGDGRLTGGTIGVTAEAITPGDAVQITDTDVLGAANIFTSDISAYSIEETIATRDGGIAVFLSDAEVAYKTSSSAKGKTLGNFANAYGDSGTEITLLKDITPTTASGFSWPIVFDWTCSSETDDGQVVVIRSNANLTIKDSSATNSDGTNGKGKITGGYDSGNGTNYGDGGGGIYVESGSLTLESGSITGNKTFDNGGGVYVGSGGTFTMKGGSITDNTADDGGGGVYVGSSCTFTMTGGFIGSTATPNKACMGGGIYIWNGNVTISGNAQIIGNQTKSYLLDSTTGGPRLNKGGGVYLSFGTLTMSGNSCISENMVDGGGNIDNTGGGVYVDGSFTVSGTPTITGNTVSGSANNVYLPDGKIITIGAGGLTSGDIGVTAENMATGIAVQITDKNVAGADGIFTSDNTLYHVEEFATGIGGTAVFLSD